MPYKRSKTSPQVSKYCQSNYYFCAISRFSSIFSHVHHFYFLFLQLLSLFCFFQCFGPCLCFLCVDFLLLQETYSSNRSRCLSPHLLAWPRSSTHRPSPAGPMLPRQLTPPSS